jgi:hypothetical protein
MAFLFRKFLGGIMNQNKPVCIACAADSERVPLLAFTFQGGQYHICPQHLPILIHKPAQLADRLPGLEELGPSEGH